MSATTPATHPDLEVTMSSFTATTIAKFRRKAEASFRRATPGMKRIFLTLATTTLLLGCGINDDQDQAAGPTTPPAAAAETTTTQEATTTTLPPVVINFHEDPTGGGLVCEALRLAQAHPADKAATARALDTINTSVISFGDRQRLLDHPGLLDQAIADCTTQGWR